MVLEREEIYFRELLTTQCNYVKFYKSLGIALLGLGIACVAGGLIWMGLRHDRTSLIASSVQVFTVLGGGLVALFFTAIPLKEIINRSGKIVTYRRLLANIERVRNEEPGDEDELAEIRATYKYITETMLKEC